MNDFLSNYITNRLLIEGQDSIIELGSPFVPLAPFVSPFIRKKRGFPLPKDFGIISNHTGDQPYFGIWNFWADEVEDLLPGGTFQDRNDPRWKTNYKKFVELDRSGRYSRLSTKKGARFDRFVIISEALHWTHIERPENVAIACLDFILDHN